MLTKTDLIEKMAADEGITKAAAGRILNNILDTIESELANGGKATLPGFGTFEARKRQAKVGRNPKTGEKIDIPASVTASFKAGKAFKEKLNA